MAEPAVELVQAAGDGSLSEAIENSAVELDGERIRFTHSLLASVLYAEALPVQRRELHRRLATLALGVEERAWHLALGNDEPNAKVAEEVGAAAEHAASRGAPEAAAELYEHAARLTPPEKVDETWHRRHEAAYHHFAAGDVERARILAEQMLSEPDCEPWRADVLVLLAFIVEDGVAVRLCLDCDRWTTVPDDHGLIDGLLLGLTLRACDHMPQGGLLSLETALIKLDKNSFEEIGYHRVNMSASASLTQGAGRMAQRLRGPPGWDRRDDSSDRVSRRSATQRRWWEARSPALDMRVVASAPTSTCRRCAETCDRCSTSPDIHPHP